MAASPAPLLLVIAGPCSLENERVCRAVAETLGKIGRANRSLKFVFKGSFDKANRSSINTARGLGLSASLDIFHEIRETRADEVVRFRRGAEQQEPAGAGTEELAADRARVVAPGAKLTDTMVVADTAALLAPTRPEKPTVVIQDPCHHRHVQNYRLPQQGAFMFFATIK